MPLEARNEIIQAQDDGRTIFHVIGSNQSISAALLVDVKSRALTRILGDNFTNDNIVDAMVTVLRDRAAQDLSVATKAIIATVCCANELRRIVKSSDGGPNLDRFENLVKSCGRTVILFPVNLDNQHWISIKVDFDTRTFSYGDSLDYSRDANVMRGLSRWLKRFPGVAFTEGAELPCGEQNDGFSCAFCMMNAMEHDLWNDALWTADRKRAYRLRWFIQLARFQATWVSFENMICTLD